jgi:hypothetical protein
MNSTSLVYNVSPLVKSPLHLFPTVIFLPLLPPPSNSNHNLKNWHVRLALVPTFKLADKFSRWNVSKSDSATFYGHLTGPKIIADIDKRSARRALPSEGGVRETQDTSLLLAKDNDICKRMKEWKREAGNKRTRLPSRQSWRCEERSKPLTLLQSILSSPSQDSYELMCYWNAISDSLARTQDASNSSDCIGRGSFVKRKCSAKYLNLQLVTILFFRAECGDNTRVYFS